MNGYNIGAFLSGAAQGWGQGARLAADIRASRIRKATEDEFKKQATVDEGYDDPELWRSDITPGSEQARMLEQQTGSMGLSRVGDRTFTSVAAARQYADKFNSIEGLYGRLADVYARHGDAGTALGLRKQVHDMEMQRRSAENAAEQAALMKQKLKLLTNQDERAAEEFNLQQQNREQQQHYRDAAAAYDALRSTDREGAIRGLRAVHAAYGGPDAVTKFEADSAAAAKRERDNTAAVLNEAYRALLTGDVARANVSLNQLDTPRLVSATGKTDKTTGQPIYHVHDLQTRQQIAAGTAEQLNRQALSFMDQMQLRQTEQQLALMKLRASGGGGGGQGTAPLPSQPVDPKKLESFARMFNLVTADREGNIQYGKDFGAFATMVYDLVVAKGAPQDAAQMLALQTIQTNQPKPKPEPDPVLDRAERALNQARPIGASLELFMPKLAEIRKLEAEINRLRLNQQLASDREYKAKLENAIRAKQAELAKLRAQPPAR